MSTALVTRPGYFREHAAVLSASGALHLVLLALLALNLDFLSLRPPKPVRLAIEATVVDARALQRRSDQQRQDAQRRVEQEKQLAERARPREVVEPQRAAEPPRPPAATVPKRVPASRPSEQAGQQRRQDAAEAQRLRREADEAGRQQAAERQRQAEEGKRKAELDRRQAQSRADLNRQLAEEERLAAAAQSGLLDQYAEIIRQKVERNWIRPPGARAGLQCVVNVKQIPGGEVVDVRVGQCNGDAAVIRSIEAAVLRSSPLPVPPDATLFDRSLRFEFKPEE
jgi:colicin import membrane protein